MASVITRNNASQLLWPGIMATWGFYETYETIWKKSFKKMDRSASGLATERLLGHSGFSEARLKTEGSPVTYDADYQDYLTEATYGVYQLAYQVTEEELADNQYAEIANRRTEQLAMSMNITAENLHANVFIQGFSNGTTYGDGQPLFSANHPTISGGPQSNLLSIASDLNEGSLEDMIQQIGLAKNTRGLTVSLQPTQLIVSMNDVFNAERILQSQLRSGTQNNDINAIKNMSLIQDGVVMNPYFGSVTGGAWYMKTSLSENEGLLSLWRNDVEIEDDNSFDTGNYKVKAKMRLVPTVGDFRCIYGSAGD